MTEAERNQELKRLKILFEDTNDHVLTFALYRDATEQRESAEQVKQDLDLPVKAVALKGDTLNPVNVLLALPKSPRLAVFFTFLGSSLPKGKSDFDKFAGYVNIQREAFADVPHALVFWLREEQLVRLMKRAPDFWAWRSGVFDFRKELQVQNVSNYQALEYLDAFERGKLEEQAALYEEILKEQLDRDEPDLAYVVRTRLRLAMTLGKLAIHDKAAKQIKKAVEESRYVKDKELERAALYFLARTHLDLGRYKEAEQILRQIIESQKIHFDGKFPDNVLVLNSLAKLLKETDRYEEAETIIRKIIKIQKATIGEQHSDYVGSLNNLAVLLKETGRYGEAESLYRRVIEIRETTINEKHPEYFKSLGNLAELLRSTSHYDEAESLHKKVIELLKATVGEQHPDYAKSLINLALLLVTIGRHDEAAQLYEKALDILIERLGNEHPHTKLAKNNHRMFEERMVREAQTNSS